MENITTAEFTRRYGKDYSQAKTGQGLVRTTPDGKVWVYTPTGNGGVWSTEG